MAGFIDPAVGFAGELLFQHNGLGCAGDGNANACSLRLRSGQASDSAGKRFPLMNKFRRANADPSASLLGMTVLCVGSCGCARAVRQDDVFVFESKNTERGPCGPRSVFRFRFWVGDYVRAEARTLQGPEKQMRVLRLTTPRLKYAWGPVRSG